MFVTNWNSTTKIQKISEITNFFRHYFLSRTEVSFESYIKPQLGCHIIHHAAVVYLLNPTSNHNQLIGINIIAALYIF